MILVKEWQVTLGGALVMFAAGVVLLLWANSIDVPTLFFEVNDFVLVSNQYFVTLFLPVIYVAFSFFLSFLGKISIFFGVVGI